jgi:hypothetical protein
MQLRSTVLVMAKNTLTMKPVNELPATRRGRQSMYVEVVRKLAAKPGQAFEVRTYNSPSAAQSGRQSLMKEARRQGVSVNAVATGNTLYAQAKETKTSRTRR